MSLLTSSPTILARNVLQRIEALGRISEEQGRLTRTFCSPAMRKANDLVAGWMREAGMQVREDAIANLIGHYPAGASPKIKDQPPSSKALQRSEKPKSPGMPNGNQQKILLLGSHLDTVRDAGKFDGPLGVLVAIACVQHLQDSGIELPFAIEVIGFADEEGVRYQSTYLGSRVLAGTFHRQDLLRVDANGVTMAEAIQTFGGNPDALETAKLDRRRLVGYVEVHIEQGPVLERLKLALGIVSAISGQARYECVFRGRAGHAGTVPMNMRADALCAAAEFVMAVEAYATKYRGLVATVGKIEALPGASNVIPGEVVLTLDVRHADDRVRVAACAHLKAETRRIARRRKVPVLMTAVHQAKSVTCDSRLSRLLERAVKKHQAKAIVLPSGAGHDAAAMVAITPVAMLFVRCKGGISHHPAESVSEKDVRAAIQVMNDFVRELARNGDRL